MIKSKVSGRNFVRFSVSILAMLYVCIGLVSCGGEKGTRVEPWNQQSSSSKATTTTWKTGVFSSASNFANKCVKLRTGADPATGQAFLDKAGTFLDENNFLRSWTNDTYLWFNEVVDKDPADYTTTDYFDLLKTTKKTASGKEKDKFHFTYDSAEWHKVSSGEATSGYGMQIAWIANTPPRNLVISFVEPTSPAKTAGVVRGAKIISIDGADLINGNDTATINKLNAGLFPVKSGESHLFVFQDVSTQTNYSLTLVSADVTPTPVALVKSLTTSNGKVGYILFNDHIKTAEAQLKSAVTQLSADGISDLVLDLRYNGGGYLDIASELAYMIAGPTVTSGKTFEKLTFNSKYQTTDFWGRPLQSTPFHNTTYFGSGDSLPVLNLSRVFVLTSGDTCSASESIINGLRGVGVKVIQIGSKTCGKPYGFYPEDNCGTTYFAIQFKGVNQKGFGEYSDGFVPSATDNNMDNIEGCTLGDDLTKPLGDPAEKNLATALYYRLNNSCTLPVASASPNGLQKTSFENELSNIRASVNKPDIQMNRFMSK